MTNDTPANDMTAAPGEEEIPACCATCFCFRPITEEGGLCLRRPPQVIVMMVPDPREPRELLLKPGDAQPRQKLIPQTQGAWPPVPLQGWCFEYVDPRDESEPLAIQQAGLDS